MFRVIETFSGIGSQAKALTRIGKPFEIVNTADWDINAILAYCLIHKGKIDINKIRFGLDTNNNLILDVAHHSSGAFLLSSGAFLLIAFLDGRTNKYRLTYERIHE